MQKALTLCLSGLRERDDRVRDGNKAAVAMESWTENAMIETPANSYSYPLAPKVEEIPIPVGYVKLGDAVEEFGQAMFPSEWTGEEREFIKWNSFGQEFRSNIEFEADREFRDAVLMAQRELECDSYGGDPILRYGIRKNIVENPNLYAGMDDLPPLSTEALKKIEVKLSEKINQAKSVRERREKAEDKLLREMLWTGSLKAHYVALDGEIIELEPHIWGAAEGQNYFKYGELSIQGYFGKACKRPILVLESAAASALNSSPMISDDEKLLDKMESLLKTDPRVKSISAAADALADEAVGGGTNESRAKRLARKYTRADRYNPKDSG